MTSPCVCFITSQFGPPKKAKTESKKKIQNEKPTPNLHPSSTVIEQISILVFHYHFRHSATYNRHNVLYIFQGVIKVHSTQDEWDI